MFFLDFFSESQPHTFVIMIDIEDHIREHLVPNILVEFQKDLIANSYTNRESVEILKIFERVLFQTGYDVSYEEIQKFIRISNNSISILCLQAFHLFSKNDFEEGLQMLDFVIDITTGRIKHHLKQVSLYIYLADVPKSDDHIIVECFEEFLSYYQPHSFELHGLMWDINSTFEGETLSKYCHIQISNLAIEKNPDETELYFYKFYILQKFKNWEELYLETKKFIKKFPNDALSTVYYYQGDSLFHQKKYIKATQAYRNSIESTDIEYERDLSNALAYKMIGICYLNIARQRRINDNTNLDLLGWYRKADSMFKKAIPHIDAGDKELYELSLQTILLIAATANVN